MTQLTQLRLVCLLGCLACGSGFNAEHFKRNPSRTATSAPRLAAAAVRASMSPLDITQDCVGDPSLVLNTNIKIADKMAFMKAASSAICARATRRC